MDHIHRCYLGPSALQIPCLVHPLQAVYTLPGDWLDYPKTQGFDLEEIRFHRWDRYPAKKLASFLQDWLFFALLRAVLPTGIDLRVEDFIRAGENGIEYITTSNLDNYLSAWENIKSKQNEDERAATSKHNERLFSEARNLIFHLSTLPNAPGSTLFPPLPLECAMSCAALGRALAIENLKSVSDRRSYETWAAGDLISEQLEIQGWCPFIVEGVVDSHEMTTIYYFTTLGGPKTARSHTRCTESLCVHTGRLEPRHTGGCEACLMIESPMSDVTLAIQKGVTSVMKYRPAMKLVGPTLEVNMSDGSAPYVAISHVWCDGLGNPGGNSIHLCQAQRLQRAVDHILRSRQLVASDDIGQWWLDTLCVPPKKLYKNEKKRAIAQMKTIYERAESVLVIDADLYSCNDNTGPLEILARLRLSNWIRRLWTFQEGFFAKSIYLLVGATPRSFDAIVEAARELPQKGYQNHIAQDLINAYDFLFVSGATVRIPTNHPQPLEWEVARSKEIPLEGSLITERVLSDVFREFSNRVATQARDEAKCLSLFLGLDTVSVLTAIEKEEEDHAAAGESIKQSSEAGMATVLRLADEAPKLSIVRPRGCFPPSIIFPICQRLRRPGFRWAPQSFLFAMARSVYSDKLPLEVHDENHGESFDRPSGVLCAHGQGLRIMFPGLIITKIDACLPVAKFFIVDSSHAPSKGRPKFWRCTFTKEDNQRAWEGDIAPTNADSGNLAIIVGGFNDLETKPSFPSILVRIKGKCTDGAYAVERLGFMVGAATPENDTFDWVRDPWARVEGSWLPLSQMWCVD